MTSFSFSPRPWSTKPIPKMGDSTQDFVVVEDEITDNLSLDSLDPSLLDDSTIPWINVKAEGAIGDGVADDTAAINAAITKAVSTGIKTVLFPSGVYGVSARIVVSNDGVALLGMGSLRTAIKMLDSSNLLHVLHIGVTNGSATNTVDCSVTGIEIDCNKANNTGTIAGIAFWNAANYRASDVWVKNSPGIGFLEDTETSGGSSKSVRARVTGLRVSGCASTAVRIKGAKDSIYSKWTIHDNEQIGVEFTGAAFGITESTECVVSDLVIATNGTTNAHPGVVFDNVNKFAVNNIVAHNCKGTGFQFRTTDAAGVKNTGTYSNLISRNCGLLGSVAAGVDLGRSQFVVINNLLVIKNAGVDATDFDVPGIYSAPDAQICELNNVTVTNSRGTAMVIDGSSQMHLSNINLRLNGESNGSVNHGLHLTGSANLILIDGLYCQNKETTGSNYELKVDASCTNIRIDGSGLASVAPGNEVSLDPAAATELKMTSIEFEPPSIANAATLAVPAFLHGARL